jgi:hypothetical protein
MAEKTTSCPWRMTDMHDLKGEPILGLCLKDECHLWMNSPTGGGGCAFVMLVQALRDLSTIGYVKMEVPDESSKGSS